MLFPLQHPKGIKNAAVKPLRGRMCAHVNCAHIPIREPWWHCLRTWCPPWCVFWLFWMSHYVCTEGSTFRLKAVWWCTTLSRIDVGFKNKQISTQMLVFIHFHSAWCLGKKNLLSPFSVSCRVCAKDANLWLSWFFTAFSPTEGQGARWRLTSVRSCIPT